MNIFRSLLFWIVLALAGALAAQLLAQDPGLVLVSYGNATYEKSLAYTLVLVIAALALLWLLWKLISTPFALIRRRRKKQARARLIEGLDALHLGHWSRAEKQLAQAVDNDEVGAAARIAAARAAAAMGNTAAIDQHLDALAGRHPTARAVAAAELAMDQGRPADALAALDASDAQPLPPRGLALRGDALAAIGRAGDAYGLLGALRQSHALPESALAAREAAWAEASLREAGDANVLADRWEALPKPLKINPATVAAYAERAAGLRWEQVAAQSVEQALDARWDESLVDLYGRLPIGRLDERHGHAERWLQAHPGSPGLLLALARISRAQGHGSKAEAYLHRALAQGANADAWEELGHGFTQTGDEPRARLSYANALRAARGEATLELPGRDLRQRIFDEAVVEERDAHGVPRLRE